MAGVVEARIQRTAWDSKSIVKVRVSCRFQYGLERRTELLVLAIQ